MRIEWDRIMDDALKRFTEKVIAEAKNMKPKYTFEGEFEITHMSPNFYKSLWGNLPKVSTIEEADKFGLVDLERWK